MTTAFIASTQPPNPKMPTDTEPANAALPTLDPQAQELARLKALVATQAEEILYVKKQAGMRCGASRAQTTKFEALSGDYAKLLEANAELLEANAELQRKYIDTLEKLAEARQRELDFNSSVCGQVVDWFANGQGNPSFAHQNFPNFVELHEQHGQMMQVRFAAPPHMSVPIFGLTPLCATGGRRPDANAPGQRPAEHDRRLPGHPPTAAGALRSPPVSLCPPVCLSDLSVGPLCVRQELQAGQARAAVATPRKRSRGGGGEEQDLGGSNEL
jgi:hypothetical protein